MNVITQNWADSKNTLTFDLFWGHAALAIVLTRSDESCNPFADNTLLTNINFLALIIVQYYSTLLEFVYSSVKICIMLFVISTDYYPPGGGVVLRGKKDWDDRRKS